VYNHQSLHLVSQPSPQLLAKPEYYSVISQRPYVSLTEIWDMVARTAYTQLFYSNSLLLVCTLLMSLMYLLPWKRRVGKYSPHIINTASTEKNHALPVKKTRPNQGNKYISDISRVQTNSKLLE
jgi:hypothetical protein